MGRPRWMQAFVAALALLVTACATTQEARHEDKTWENFTLALAERQVARRRQTAELCRSQGVALPARYVEKGGGMLEEYVPSRPPCGLSARERIVEAEADFRGTWKTVMGIEVPLGYEWLLSGKRRIAEWLDADSLTPDEARTALREAQWVLAEWEYQRAAPATQSSEASDTPVQVQVFAKLNAALNEVLVAQGIRCRQGSQAQPCF